MLLAKQMNPQLRRILPFATTQQSNCEKYLNQYVYRFMAFTQGSATLILNDEHVVLSKGSLLYLCPGQRYRILNTHGNFNVVNLHFDLTNQVFNLPGHCATLLDQNFQKDCIPQICQFSDCEVLNHSSYLLSFEDGLSIIQEILYESYSEDILNHTRQNLLLTDLIIQYIRTATLASTNRKKRQNIEEILTYINDHCMEKLNTQTLAEHFYYHPNYLNLLVRNTTGMTLHQYIIKVKLEMVTQLLYETNMTIDDIAQYMSFYDGSHLSTTYYRKYRCYPSEIRRSKA